MPVSTLPPRFYAFTASLGLAGALVFADTGAARADVKLPSIFGSHMVLQRDQKDRVWGKADPKEEVTVSINGKSKQTTAGDDGAWNVTLDPMPAGGPYTCTLTVKWKEHGRVWTTCSWARSGCAPANQTCNWTSQQRQ